MKRAGGKSFEASRISAMTEMKDWFPAKAKAMLSMALTVSMKLGLPTRTMSTLKPGGALGPEMPTEIMTMRTAATMEIVQTQLRTAAKVSLRGRQRSQHAMWGNAMKATVHIAWLVIVLRAMDLRG